MDSNNFDAEEQKKSLDEAASVQDDQDLYQEPVNMENVKLPDDSYKNLNKQFITGAFVGFATTMVVTLVSVILIGYFGGFRIQKINTPSTVTTNSTALKDNVLDEATIEKVNAVLTVFDMSSILELNKEDIQRAIIDGVIKGSGDKYAQYYNEKEITDLMGDYGGSFYGIGASLSLNSFGYAEVQSVYSNSPAERGGVRDGDIITEVDGKDVYGMTLDEIVALVRGPEGTDVIITVAREGEKDYLNLVLTRAKIEVVVVEYEMKEDNIGYIHIEQWYETTSAQFAEAMSELRSQGMEGLVIDLRSNTGGLLTAVVDVARQMLPEGIVVYTENKNGRHATYECDGTQEIDIPVVILTNGYTASASEILTAAMKDHNKAVSIGTKTYGKGVVQSFFDFTDGTAMKLTTEQYFTPNGTAIDGIGIEPDILVEFDSEAYYDSENHVDNQLEAAMDYLKK